MSARPHHHLAILRAKARTGIWIEAGGAVLTALVAYAAVTLVLDRSLRLEWPFRLALLLAFVVVVARVLRRRLLQPLAVGLDDDEMALAVERASPETRQALISSVQFERVLVGAAPVPESRAMMQALVDDVHARLQAIPFQRALDGRRVLKFGGLMLAAAAVFGGWAAIDAGSLRLWALRNLALSSLEWPRYTRLEFAREGDGPVRLPQGDSLTVRVLASGRLPDQVFLYYRFAGGEKGYEPMSATGDAEFTWTIESVLEDVVLRAEGGDGLSEELSVAVVERPRISDLTVTLTFPDYMQKDREVVTATEGELRVPRGARLDVAGRSHKPIREAFLLFGEQKTALNRTAEDSFEGQFTPTATGLMLIDVIDQDLLGAGTPPRLYLRLGDDRPPSLDFKLRGIGALITNEARIPGDLKVKDDFGLRSVGVEYRAVQESGADGSRTEQPAEVPFEVIEPIWGTVLRPGATRHESTANVDLKPLLAESDPDSPRNPIRPGMLLSLRFFAVDNFGPGDPHRAHSEVISFRVVSREKLIEELRRRQVEQRQELQRILEEEKLALLELRETLNPTATDERARQAQNRLRSLARTQTALGRRTGFVGDIYQRILWEFENNRVLESAKVREMEALITAPLAALAKDDFPATSRLTEDFALSGTEATRNSAVSGYERVVARLEAVLKQMEQAETLAALLEELRAVIKMQDSAMQGVERRLRQQAEQLFAPGSTSPGEPRDGRKE